jgi:hypothetical protein
MSFVLSKHAAEEIKRRDIPLEFLERVLENPEQIVLEKNGAKAYQSKVTFENGKLYLIRAIVSDEIQPSVVITVYRTSNISKYWRISLCK